MEASFSARKRSAQRPLVHRRSVPTRISKLNLRSASDDVITLPPAGGPALDFFLVDESERVSKWGSVVSGPEGRSRLYSRLHDVKVSGPTGGCSHSIAVSGLFSVSFVISRAIVGDQNVLDDSGGPVLLGVTAWFLVPDVSGAPADLGVPVGCR